MGEWVEQVHHRARLIHDQIASVIEWAPQTNVDATAAMLPYQKLLERLYLEELPYAKLLDDSDLVVHAEGSATETEEPRVSALAHLLEQLREESRKIAKVVAGVGRDEKANNIDLLLSGLAHGSLVIGLRVAPPADDPRQTSLIREDEPVFQAIRTAIQSLSVIPHFITSNGMSDDFAKVITDPAVRDASLVAVQRLSPTGRIGIDRISISAPGRNEGQLTPVDRKNLRGILSHPKLKRSGVGTFEGVVRELDLDARRFEIRHVEGIGAIRCVFTELRAENARKWLDREVRVHGVYEADSDGRPRFLSVDTIEVLQTPDSADLF